MERSSSIKYLLASLGSELKEKRIKLGISQEELAYRSGLHRTYITDIERGNRNITLLSISRLAAALKVPLAELFAKVEKKGISIPDVTEIIDSSSPIDILLVEDNPTHVELTVTAIKSNGVSNPIHIAASGEEAIEILFQKTGAPIPQRAAKPKLILLDLTLPKMSGIEVLKLIRADQEARLIPVIILTASRSDQDYKECAKLGVSAFINKPLDFTEFSMAVPKLGFRWQLTEQ